MTASNPTMPRPRSRRVLLAVGVGLAMLAAGAPPGGAQTTTTTQPPPESTTTTTAPPESTTTTAAPTTAPPESTTTTAPQTTTTTAAGPSEAERELLEQADARTAAEVDATSAELGDLNDALRVLRDQVAEQEAAAGYAGTQVAEAEQAAAAAQAEVVATEADLESLRSDVADMAVRAFTGDLGDAALLLTTTDPTEALRMEILLAAATQTDLDVVEELRIASEDLEAQRAEADQAVEEAASRRAENEAALAALQQDRDAQAQVAESAEDRLDQLLSEQAALQAIGADLEAGRPIDDLAALLASNPTAPAPPAGDVAVPDFVSEADIVDVGKGILVHVSIADQVRQLLADADAAGIDLGGGGYRSPAAQIATRRNNCGTSNYAIYEMPASQCSPPTARPGRSMHEKGLAIDFTYNGSLIRSRSGPGWEWLLVNAPRYGLANLPSEPWHWSTNGN